MSKLDPTDEQILKSASTGIGLIPIANVGQLEVLAQAAKETHEKFLETVRTIMTPDRAKMLRRLRVDEGYTWRAVARACHKKFKGTWQPESNQIAGMALCEIAAETFGENYMNNPWN